MAGTTTPFDSVEGGAASAEGTILASTVFVAADGLGMTFPSESVVAGTSGAKAEFVDANGFATSVILVSVGTGGMRVSPVIAAVGDGRVEPVIVAGRGRSVSPIIVGAEGKRVSPRTESAEGKRVSPMIEGKRVPPIIVGAEGRRVSPRTVGAEGKRVSPMICSDTDGMVGAGGIEKLEAAGRSVSPTTGILRAVGIFVSAADGFGTSCPRAFVIEAGMTDPAAAVKSETTLPSASVTPGLISGAITVLDAAAVFEITFPFESVSTGMAGAVIVRDGLEMNTPLEFVMEAGISLRTVLVPAPALLTTLSTPATALLTAVVAAPPILLTTELTPATALLTAVVAAPPISLTTELTPPATLLTAVLRSPPTLLTTELTPPATLLTAVVAAPPISLTTELTPPATLLTAVVAAPPISLTTELTPPATLLTAVLRSPPTLLTRELIRGMTTPLGSMVELGATFGPKAFVKAVYKSAPVGAGVSGFAETSPNTAPAFEVTGMPVSVAELPSGAPVFVAVAAGAPGCDIPGKGRTLGRLNVAPTVGMTSGGAV